MSKIFKICLLVTLFLSTASIAWASFNYDSVRNHFLITSLLRVDGKYIAIGDVEPPTNALMNTSGSSTTDAFLLISGNLIFLGQGPLEASAERKIGVEAGKTFITANKIMVQSANQRFVITTSGAPLEISSATKISMNNDFKVQNNQGLTFLDSTEQPINTLVSNTIFVDKILTNNLSLLSGSTIKIADPTTLTLSSATGQANVSYITLGEQPFCNLVSWSMESDKENWQADKENRGDSWAGAGGDIENKTNCPEPGGIALPGGAGDLRYTKKTCCPKNYYVFDVDLGDAAASRAKMVCCRAASGPFVSN